MKRMAFIRIRMKSRTVHTYLELNPVTLKSLIKTMTEISMMMTEFMRDPISLLLISDGTLN